MERPFRGSHSAADRGAPLHGQFVRSALGHDEPSRRVARNPLPHPLPPVASDRAASGGFLSRGCRQR
eukprot:1088300-Pyramimonas_sp.AAC.1